MRKNISLAASTIVAASTILSVPTSSFATSNSSAEVKEDTTLYKQANKKKELRKLKKSAKVTVIRKTGTWTKVKYGSKTGYILTKKLKFSSDSKLIEKAIIEEGKSLVNKHIAPFERKINDNSTNKEKVNYIYNKVPNIQKDFNAYATKVENLNISEKKKNSIYNKYVQPNLVLVESYTDDVKSVKLISETFRNIKVLRYENAKISYEQFKKNHEKSKETHIKNNLPMPEKIMKAFNSYKETLERKLSYATYEELLDAGVVKDSEYFDRISPTSPLLTAQGKKINGFKTNGQFVKDTTPANGYREFSIQTFELPKNRFKGVKFNVSAGNQVNLINQDFNYKLSNEREVKPYQVEKSYHLNNFTVQKEWKFSNNLNNVNTFKIHIYSPSIKDIAFTDFKFYIKY